MLISDRGFTITELLKPLGVALNIPAFLKGQDQLSHEDVTESQTIAAVRIHVERAIQGIKKFRQIRNEIYPLFYMVLLIKFGLSVVCYVIL